MSAGITPPDNQVEGLQPVRDDIAANLAELASMDVAPPGGLTVPHFSASDVDFTTHAWQDRLRSVAPWLSIDASSLPVGGADDYLVSLRKTLDIDVHDTSELTLLEALSARASNARTLAAAYSENLAAGMNASSAGETWQSSWEEIDDEPESFSEPVSAATDAWRINDFIGQKINLSPSYQRSDVWTLSQRQSLIESILRGIPLPSVILLRVPGQAGMYEVVDGRQRLTTVLRFIGRHPVALTRVKEMEDTYPGKELAQLFGSNYKRFKQVWKALSGTPLTSADEDKYHFPFALHAKSKALTGPLESLKGKYFCEIGHAEVPVVDGSEDVETLFTGPSQYKVPLIRYNKASPQQIHDVFKLYNKQGSQLNAEEIRNAVYHETDLNCAVLEAVGDFQPRDETESIAPFLKNVDGIAHVKAALDNYGVSTKRYRRSKILGWVLATYLHDPSQGDETAPRFSSTASHIDGLFERIQSGRAPELERPDVLSALFQIVSQAVEAHAGWDEEVWSEDFVGPKWLDLELVGTLVGVLAATTFLGDDLDARMDDNAERIELASYEWRRPTNAQTNSQWTYIASVALGVLNGLGVSTDEAHKAAMQRFGVSALKSLSAVATANQPKVD